MGNCENCSNNPIGCLIDYKGIALPDEIMYIRTISKEKDYCPFNKWSDING